MASGRCFCNNFLNVTLNTTTAYCKSFCAGEIITEYSSIILQILYVVTLVVGLIGNLLTCIVIKMRKSMRRSIHVYTFNLAVCDIIILMFFVPPQMITLEHHLNWVLGLTVCKVNNIILPAALSTSVFTLLAITVDRARGLIQPFKWRSDSLLHAKVSVPVIWIVSVLIGIPLLIYPTVTRETFDGLDLLLCYEIWPSQVYERTYWLMVFALLYVLPLLIMIFLHLFMVAVISKDKNTRHRKQNHKMIRLTIAVVLVFSVCTGMQHTYYLITTFGKFHDTLDLKTQGLIFCVSNFVVSVQAALNPILYGTLRRDFNKAFKSLLYKLMGHLKIRKSKISSVNEKKHSRCKKRSQEKLMQDFDDFFDARKISLAARLVNKMTDSGFYSIPTDMSHSNSSDVPNNTRNEYLDELKEELLSTVVLADSPLPAAKFCLLSDDVLQRISFYMMESQETDI